MDIHGATLPCAETSAERAMAPCIRGTMLQLAGAAGSGGPPGLRDALTRLLAVALAGVLIAACEDNEPETQSTPEPKISVSIATVIADDHQTAVRLAFENNLPQGTLIAAPSGSPQLTDTTGVAHHVSRVAPVEAGGQVWIFPAIPAVAGELVLQIPELQVIDPTQTPDPATFERTLVPGPWTVRFEWDGKRVDSTTYTFDLDPLPYGPGELVVESVTVSEAGVVVDGYISGFTMDEVPELQMYPPSVVLPSGTSLAILTGGNGWGEKRERWSFRFAPATSVDGATLTIPFTVTNHPHDMAAAESLRERGGPSVSVVLETE